MMEEQFLEQLKCTTKDSKIKELVTENADELVRILRLFGQFNVATDWEDPPGVFQC